MAEKNKKSEKTPEQIAQERQARRDTQWAFFTDKGLTALTTAYAGRIDDKTGAAKYGQVGADAVYPLYLETLRSPTKPVSQGIYEIFLEAESASERYQGSVTGLNLLKKASQFRYAGMGSLYVEDVISYVGAKVSDDVISPEQRKMTLQEFQDDDKEKAGRLISVLMTYDERTGVGNAIVKSGKRPVENLEEILAQTEDKKTK
ncbi:MAG TPA: hypothetical protein PLK34_01200 [Candidatus Pacearchaeota archaeon]|nr:hypothetical protein [Candidatus Pacearchaeota archaeon]